MESIFIDKYVWRKHAKVSINNLFNLKYIFSLRPNFVGYYAVREPPNFIPYIMGAKRHNAILWTEYFAYKNQLPHIRHVASSDGLGEKWIKLSSGLVRVDGYCSFVDNNGTRRQIVLEYHEVATVLIYIICNLKFTDLGGLFPRVL